ncbi:Na-Ca exchanger/integrin-beta4 domain protein [Candidatus Thiomargarita nelsonii]|uniref:Na-Ca exchanger/integrin-beta4 domain protein n=1 Tax=Candidatus Thiomargarita nelsonii TaxID=1003181 RepID=A0A176S1K5_9GAMM|nr:Na-Ca exchanger/integrin-beta4 domain protein [Candidatus Thiomargarita nelsonii]
MNCKSSDASATAGKDYTAVSKVLKWSDGDASDKTCTVPIIDDSDVEGNETFSLKLENATGATIGAQNEAVVTIVDNDKVAAPSGRPALGPFYRIAYNAAKRLAQNAWYNLGKECTNTSVFVQIVGNGVDDAANDIGTKYKGRSAEQFGNGFIDGLIEVLDEVVDRCVNECEMLGKASGEWSAKMFCRVAEVVKHAPTFTVKQVNIRGTICGGAYRLGCESNFVGTISNMCPNYTQGSSVRSFYRAAENGCCSYNPY